MRASQEYMYACMHVYIYDSHTHPVVENRKKLLIILSPKLTYDVG